MGGGRGVAPQALLSCRRFRRERNVADRGLRLGFDFRFALSRATPWRDDEPWTAVHDLLEFRVAVGFRRVLGTELDRAVVERLLDEREQLLDLRGESVHRHE